MSFSKGPLHAVTCTSCGMTLPILPGAGLRTARCAGCDTEIQAELFPALFRGLAGGGGGEALGSDGEAACFYHERKRAAAVCEECGRFICSLCEVRIGGRTVCPTCVDRGRSEESMEVLVTRRTMYDGVALSLSVLPLLFFFMTPVTAPLALFIAVRHWKKPGSILRGTKIRFVLAIVIALLQVAAWAFIILEITNRA